MADAACEDGVGRAGFVVVANPGTPEVTRVGRRLGVPREVYRRRGDQVTYIAQLELVVVLAVLVECSGLLKDTSSSSSHD